MSRHVWTSADVAMLQRRYPVTPSAQIAAEMGLRVHSISHKARKLGLRKTPEYLATPLACRLRPGSKIGGKTRFKKGFIPWNKGMKGWAAGGRSAQTRFKKGNRPHTWRPLGSTRLNDGYLQRKVTDTGYPPRDWQSVHVLLWIEHRGPVPPGHAVVFRDGNRQHIALDNLELVSRAELVRRNTIHRYPAEVKQVIRLAGKLKRAIEKEERAR